jgi:hypothetical protein
MRPHRFDPPSFVTGAVFVLFAAVLLFGHVGLHDLRPTTLWIWPVLAFGGLLTAYGVRRLWESREPAIIVDDEPPADDAVS